MKIDSSNVGMESARSYKASNTTTRRFSITDYRQGSLSFTGNGLNAAVTGGQIRQQASKGEKENQTEQSTGKRLYTVKDWQESLKVSSSRVKIRTNNRNSYMDEFHQQTVRYIFELFFSNGWNRWRNWSEDGGMGDPIYGDATGGVTAQTSYMNANFHSTVYYVNGSSASGANIMGPGAASQGGITWTDSRMLTYGEENTFFEQEDTVFSTVGTVRTADGREIKFNVDIGMSRQFQDTFRNELRLDPAKMCDPLVINLDTDVAELSDQKFFFDIDADGQMDEISQLGSGSGYLALDKNNDGVINDGSELFGTSSGDGFADLAKYDEDGNGWIDENDAIWSKLKIWCKGPDGQDILYRLADKGVGAICLQRVATDFTLQNAQGQTNGAIRSTGVFLYENGNVGTMQHVDVAKFEQGA